MYFILYIKKKFVIMQFRPSLLMLSICMKIFLIKERIKKVIIE